MDELIAAWTSNESWQRLSHDMILKASRMPERTGISSLVDIRVRFGAIGRGGGDVEEDRCGGRSRIIGRFDVERRRVG